MPVIRVDDEVYEAIKQRAIELDLIFGGPNDVLKHDYLNNSDEKVSDSFAENLGNAIVIELKSVEPKRRHALIPIPRVKRRFFPGFKVGFTLITDAGMVTTRITSAPEGTPIGDPAAGAYIQGNLRDWYDHHPELEPGQKLRFEAVEPGQKYKLTVLHR